MKAIVTFFFNNILTWQLISATRPGFDMRCHITVLIVHICLKKIHMICTVIIKCRAYVAVLNKLLHNRVK